jgi:hypothetical protein
MSFARYFPVKLSVGPTFDKLDACIYILGFKVAEIEPTTGRRRAAIISLSGEIDNFGKRPPFKGNSENNAKWCHSVHRALTDIQGELFHIL